MDTDSLLIACIFIVLIAFFTVFFLYKLFSFLSSSEENNGGPQKTSSSHINTVFPSNNVVIERKREQKKNDGKIAQYGSKPTYEFMYYRGGIAEWRAKNSSPADRIFSIDKLHNEISDELTKPIPNKIKLSALKTELEYLKKYNKRSINNDVHV